MRERDHARRLYRRVLACYPKAFRERVGVSMEQTFADNVRERRAEGGRLVGFLAWTFAEAGVGAMKERIRCANVNVLAAIGGILLFLPFSIMELSTASGLSRDTFAYPLHVAMMFLGFLFIRTSIGAVRTTLTIRQGPVAVRSMITIAVQLQIVAFVALTWVTMVVDQMPCFLGATGC